MHDVYFGAADCVFVVGVETDGHDHWVESPVCSEGGGRGDGCFGCGCGGRGGEGRMRGGKLDAGPAEVDARLGVVYPGCALDGEVGGWDS